MRIDDYAKWLRTLVFEAVVQNYIKRCRRVEKNLDVSLDLEFRKDGGASLLDQLTYTTEDWQKHRPLRCSLNFKAGSDWYNVLASLKTAVKKYFEFCQVSVSSQEY